MSLNIQTSSAGQAKKVFDVVDPDRHGKIIRAGAEVSEVRFDDGVERNIPNDHLRSVETPDKAAHELDSPVHEPEAAAIRDGQQAWRRLKDNPTWKDWKAVGVAHVIGRTTAMRYAHTNKPKGRGYCAALSAWARKHGFADLDSGDRTRLFAVMDHLKEIEDWLQKLPEPERLRLNHPSSVWRKWKAATVAPKPDSETRLSPTQKLKDELVAVIEERDRYKRAVERGGGDLWDKTDRVKDISKVMIDQLGKTKAEKVAREILAALKEAR
jgi:hypothetical protein